jgi:hypothetical protein
MDDGPGSVTEDQEAPMDMEAARDLVRRGRGWLDLTPQDIERGARAVLSSPMYRAELEAAAGSVTEDQEATDAEVAAYARGRAEGMAVLRADLDVALHALEVIQASADAALRSDPSGAWLNVESIARYAIREASR